MLIQIPNLLDPDVLKNVNQLLDSAGTAWVDGRVTAGHQGASVKLNQQIEEQSEIAFKCQNMIASALERNPLFISAALPKTLYPPMFNRYAKGMAFGPHVDGGIRLHPHTGEKLRTDLSMTIFLSDPNSYEGGELEIEDTYGKHLVKMPAGDMVLYPSSSLHQVLPVTKGVRQACFTWVQSMIRSDEDRGILYGLDRAVQQLIATDADDQAMRMLMGTYHNLLRKWGEI